MALTRVLIAVKTYPTLSSKYDELVCTAGFKEDGTWIRIYPIPFRKLEYDKRYSKYDWVEIDLVKNTSDFRPESFKPKSIEANFEIVGNLDTNHNWHYRKEIVLKNTYTSLANLIIEAKDRDKLTSLAVFKPKAILDFTIEWVEREWDKKKLDALKANAQQLNLFKNSDNPFEVVKKYWRSLGRHEGDERKACLDVKKKYFEDFAKTKDLYLFLGTTREFHLMAPNPFVIIGTFHPKKDENSQINYSNFL
jgi:hypothetical protein